MNDDLQKAIDNFDAVIHYLISNPPEDFNINLNELMKDYNLIRQELSKTLVDK